MNTPSEIKLVSPNHIDVGHLCLLKLDGNIHLALSCTVPEMTDRKYFMLINKSRPDGKRLITLDSFEHFEIHDLGKNFSIKASMHPDKVSIGQNNNPDNILVCAKASGLDLTRFMFVGIPGEGAGYIDIIDWAMKYVRSSNTNVNFHSWKIIDGDGEIIYNYPPTDPDSAPQT